MDIIDKLNSVYTIKFTEDYEIIKRENKKYFLLNTFDDKKYIFKVYIKNTNNLTKLRDTNAFIHIMAKEFSIFNDYVINKDYESITEFEDQIGTLYPFNEGNFIQADDIDDLKISKLAEFTYEFHTKSRELLEDSFTIKQIEPAADAFKRYVGKIRDEMNENGIHYMLENKFGVILDRDVVELNLNHIESISQMLADKDTTILNMDLSFSNLTMAKVDLALEESVVTEDLEITNVMLDRIYVGHPYFEIGKTLSKLFIDTNPDNLNKLKSTFLNKYNKKVFMESEMIDAIISFNLIDIFYKFIKYEYYRENEERFEIVKGKLVKDKFLRFI